MVPALPSSRPRLTSLRWPSTPASDGNPAGIVRLSARTCRSPSLTGPRQPIDAFLYRPRIWQPGFGVLYKMTTCSAPLCFTWQIWLLTLGCWCVDVKCQVALSELSEMDQPGVQSANYNYLVGMPYLIGPPNASLRQRAQASSPTLINPLGSPATLLLEGRDASRLLRQDGYCEEVMG